MDLRFELLKEMVKSGFCGEFGLMMQDNDIEFDMVWDVSDFDDWFDYTINRSINN